METAHATLPEMHLTSQNLTPDYQVKAGGDTRATLFYDERDYRSATPKAPVAPLRGPVRLGRQ